MDSSVNLIALGLALASGIFMAVQGSLNAVLSKYIGLIETTFLVHAIGTVILMIVLFVLKMGKGSLASYAQAPWYAYLGGVISVLIIYLVAASIPQVGMANATTAIIVGQVLTALLIDYFGGFGLTKSIISWCDFLGLMLLAAGAYLLLK
ncbi:MAG: DMT family transporter [Pelosinus sp.]|nr:DMT family transporter [Pelosinus sp.]